MIAAILAGGVGKRLRPYTDDMPKPLIEVLGKPIIQWQIEWLKRHGLKEFVLLVGYKREKIIEYIGSGSRLEVRVTYVVEDEPLGTAGAVKNAEHILGKADLFLLLNGDILTNLNPLKLLDRISEGYLGATAAIPLPSPYGVLELEGSRVRDFVEKPQIKDIWINAGVYMFRPEALRYIPERGDLERTAFPRMAREGVLGVVKYENVFWKAIDTYKDLEEASKAIEMLGGRL